jgi:hypothetical protein
VNHLKQVRLDKQKLLQQLQELEKEEVQTKTLIRRKFQEQQKELEATGIDLNGAEPPLGTAVKPPDEPPANSRPRITEPPPAGADLDQKFGIILDTLGKLENRLNTMEKARPAHPPAYQPPARGNDLP